LIEKLINGKEELNKSMKETIKIFLKHNWFKIILIIIVLKVVGGAFYWYEWRPSQIRKDCYNIARDKAIEKAGTVTGDRKFAKDDYDTYYKWCLEKYGL